MFFRRACGLRDTQRPPVGLISCMERFISPSPFKAAGAGRRVPIDLLNEDVLVELLLQALWRDNYG